MTTVFSCYFPLVGGKYWASGLFSAPLGAMMQCELCEEWRENGFRNFPLLIFGPLLAEKMDEVG